MSRRPRSAARPAARGRDDAPAASEPFKALSALKKARPAAPAQAARQRSAAPPPAPDNAGAQPAIEDEAELFRRSVAGVAPLPAKDRAEVEAPRPPPVPRQREADPAPAESPPPKRSGDPLRDAYADVTPLGDSGRVELRTTTNRRAGRPREPEPIADKTAHPAGELPPVVLPADADLSDPGLLFRLAARGARRIDDRGRVEIEAEAPAPQPLKREADEREALQESLLAPLTFEDRLDMGDEAAFLRPGLPRRVLTDLRRGRWVLQAQIDLHGLTRDEAREALAHFLSRSLNEGKRCIRVIHGKGLGSPGKVPILKQLSRGWLAQREEILAFCQAGPHDGGGGALLVLMRAQNAARR